MDYLRSAVIGFLVCVLFLAAPAEAVLVPFAQIADGQIKVDLDVVAGAIVGIQVQNLTSKTAIFSMIRLGIETKTTIKPNTTLTTITLTSIAVVDGLGVYLGGAK
jgi:hypothetical protein